MLFPYLRMCGAVRRRRGGLTVDAPSGLAVDAPACVVRCLKNLVRLNYGSIDVGEENDGRVAENLYSGAARFWPGRVLLPHAAGPAQWRAVTSGTYARLQEKLSAHPVVTCAMPLDASGVRRRCPPACSALVDTRTGECVVFVCRMVRPNADDRRRIRGAAESFVRRVCPAAASKPGARIVRVDVRRSSSTLAAVLLAVAAERATCAAHAEQTFRRWVRAPGWRARIRAEILRRVTAVWTQRLQKVREYDDIHKWFAYEADTLPSSVSLRFPNGVEWSSVPSDSVRVKMHVSLSDFVRLSGWEDQNDVPVAVGTRVVGADGARLLTMAYDGADEAGVKHARVVSESAVHDPPLWEQVSGAPSAGQKLRVALVPRDRRFPCVHQLADVRSLLSAVREACPNAPASLCEAVALV